MHTTYADATFEQYLHFHNIQIASRDVDPVYPVLRELGGACGWNTEQMIVAVLLHVAYYDMGSTLTAMEMYLESGNANEFLSELARRPRLPCGTERRRHRMGSNLQHHLESLFRAAEYKGSFREWLTSGLTERTKLNWRTLTARLLDIQGNGRWAAYKTCEMLAEVCDLPLEAPDMGHVHSTGPRQGLAMIIPEARISGNSIGAINSLDRISAGLVQRMQACGAQVTLATAETTLCDFHSMAAGRYYPGLDIDVMLQQINNAGFSLGMRSEVMAARKRCLPRAYLGEECGWNEPDARRKKIYRNTGEILTRDRE